MRCAEELTTEEVLNLLDFTGTKVRILKKKAQLDSARDAPAVHTHLCESGPEAVCVWHPPTRWQHA
jgi:hypothetical protein